jgi:hypothetical protein
MPFFGVPIRNGLPLGLGSVVGLAKQSVAPSPPPPSSDPYFEYVNLLLNTTSTNGAQNNTFLDSSTNNFTVTRNGDTTQGSFNPYMPSGYWSGFFDGTGDYLSAANATLAPGTGDFTYECWIYYLSASDSPIIETRSASTTDGFTLTAFSSSVIRVFSGSVLIASSGTSFLNTWTHVAVAKASGTTTLYINGVSIGTTASLGNLTNTDIIIAGGRYSGSSTVSSFGNGYISNFRFVKGTAVYTAAFTPPTTPLTAITNTSLLCLQDNRFKDNSTNNFAITRNGDTRISKFAPFNPPASYSTASYGGSGYFDGTGDYLTAPDNAAFDFGSGDFTVEMWYYPLALPAETTLISKWNSGSVPASNQWLLYLGSAVASAVFSTDGTNAAATITGPNVVINQWNHIAFVRNGNSFTVYVNGVGGTSVTNSGTLYALDTEVLGIGYRRNSGIPVIAMNGYASQARIVKGTAVYTATFTPPTTPLTAITNTSLLLNFTNAGIYDAATINDVRTVGNLQVSTTQAKFGTTSMYFDGTGDYGDVLSVPENAARTGAFTLETWAYLATADAGVERYIFFQYGPGVVLGVTSGNYVFGAAYLTILASTNTIPLDQWVHIALVREGTGANQFKLYVNGVLADTDTSTRDLTQSPIRIGATNTATSPWKGYLDEMRMTNGYARYTGNFTPPTAAFPTL